MFWICINFYLQRFCCISVVKLNWNSYFCSVKTLFKFMCKGFLIYTYNIEVQQKLKYIFERFLSSKMKWGWHKMATWYLAERSVPTGQANQGRASWPVRTWVALDFLIVYIHHIEQLYNALSLKPRFRTHSGLISDCLQSKWALELKLNWCTAVLINAVAKQTLRGLQQSLPIAEAWINCSICTFRCLTVSLSRKRCKVNVSHFMCLFLAL